ncbi:MAG: AraC family transcriptional regulator [Clostridiales bacterium]|nr:AraC family transcriptional regulator [Clostridiales bacterium]
MEQAQALLTGTDLSITRISNQAGFTDYTYFCRSFKKEFGLSAQNYRKQRKI